MTEPIDTSKRAADMSESERQSLLAELSKPPLLPPVDTTRMARNMSEQERQTWLADLRRRFQ